MMVIMMIRRMIMIMMIMLMIRMMIRIDGFAYNLLKDIILLVLNPSRAHVISHQRSVNGL